MAQSPPKGIETTTVRQATVGARKLADAMPSKERHHHAAASIALVRLWSAVNQDPVTSRCPEQRTIALANVKKM